MQKQNKYIDNTEFFIYAAKRIQGSSIISSITSKLDGKFYVELFLKEQPSYIMQQIKNHVPNIALNMKKIKTKTISCSQFVQNM